MSKPTDLVQGTLDLLILRMLVLEPMHGWAIAQRIHHMSGEVLQVGQSALYPCLHKLEQNGWISSEWAASCWAALRWLKKPTTLPKSNTMVLIFMFLL